MLTLRSVVIALVTTLMLGACAATGPQFTGLDPVKDGNANLYLYRKGAFVGGGASYTFKIDGKPVGELYNASFQVVSLKPGKYTLEVDPGAMKRTSTLEVSVESGKTYFYEYEFATGILANPFHVGASIALREKDVATADLQTLKRAR